MAIFMAIWPAIEPIIKALLPFFWEKLNAKDTLEMATNDPSIDAQSRLRDRLVDDGVLPPRR